MLSVAAVDQGKCQSGTKEKTSGVLAAGNKEMAQQNNTSAEDGPLTPRTELGPIAMSYDMESGWTAEPLGPRSKHWKRLAREAKTNTCPTEKSPTCLKRESPISLEDLESEDKSQKRRKGGKQSTQTGEEETPKDGGVAVAAAQHRRAK